jgi:hypothetical protein
MGKTKTTQKIVTPFLAIAFESALQANFQLIV